jgi:hypothetical protein
MFCDYDYLHFSNWNILDWHKNIFVLYGNFYCWRKEKVKTAFTDWSMQKILYRWNRHKKNNTLLCAKSCSHCWQLNISIFWSWYSKVFFLSFFLRFFETCIDYQFCTFTIFMCFSCYFFKLKKASEFVVLHKILLNCIIRITRSF